MNHVGWCTTDMAPCAATVPSVCPIENSGTTHHLVSPSSSRLLRLDFNNSTFDSHFPLLSDLCSSWDHPPWPISCASHRTLPCDFSLGSCPSPITSSLASPRTPLRYPSARIVADHIVSRRAPVPALTSMRICRTADAAATGSTRIIQNPQRQLRLSCRFFLTNRSHPHTQLFGMGREMRCFSFRRAVRLRYSWRRHVSVTQGLLTGICLWDFHRRLK